MVSRIFRRDRLDVWTFRSDIFRHMEYRGYFSMNKLDIAY